MVVYCHTSSAIGGYGVELFMIISGFVAMYSTEQSIEHYCLFHMNIVEFCNLCLVWARH